MVFNPSDNLGSSTPPPHRRLSLTEPSLLDSAPDEMRELIASWCDDPQLGRLAATLHAQARPNGFYDRYAEAIVARRLVDVGVPFRYEVPVPNGRHADFQVTLGSRDVFMHIKRLNAGDGEDEHAAPITSRLRYLERIARPYIVSIRGHEGMSDSQMQQFVTDAAKFIRRSRVGDELVVRDSSGEIGGLRIVAPWDGTHVTLASESASGFVDDMPRFAKLMRKAVKQFMPGAPNVVLIASDRSNGRSDYESALLGTHIERWDAFPPKGRRIAHGRASDGFWHGNRYFDFQAAGLFRLSPEQVDLDCRLWLRAQSGLSTSLMRRLIALLDTAER